nr:hypothetical protein [Tanacetum cinerariifolium]
MEIFQRNTLSSSESAPTFIELFEINELKAQAQAKDIVILKMKEKLRSLNGNVNERNVKREFEEIETLNIELDHKVTKLVAENENLKQTYKQLYDSIRSLRVRSKEHCDDLINKVNIKSAEVSDLNASLQKKVLVITALKEQLNKLKGKAVLTEAVSLNPIDPDLLKVDVGPLVPKLRKNRTAHTDYIRHTQDAAAILGEIVESERLLSPLNTSLDYACCPNHPLVLGLRLLKEYDRRSLSAHLARQGLVRGLPKLKFEKDHLCSACAMGKSTKKTHKPKSEDTNQEKLYLLHMDLCSPIRVEIVNGKKYILVIVDDYSRFTWVKFLRSKHETSDFIIKFLKMIQVDISHETSVARSPQQNGVVERRNRTLIEAAHTMLIYAQAPLFLWAEVVATACFTQNRSIIRLRHGKTPYEPLHSKFLDLSFFLVFCALCYPTNDSENLGKLQPKADIGIFIGYAPTKKAFQIYNRRTGRIVETIHVDFDELTSMASEQSSLGPALNDMTPGTISSGLVHTSSSLTSYVPPSRNDWDLLFQLMFNELLNPPPSKDLNEFERLEVWELIPRPDQVMVITLKWIYKMKLDELGGNLKNNARLVARGYRQEEGIDFEESFALALYGLKQAPRAWCDMLSSFLLSQDFSKDLVDPTLFIRSNSNDLLLDYRFLKIPEASLSTNLNMLLNHLRNTVLNLTTQWILQWWRNPKLDEDREGKVVDPSHYRGMIGTLLYLTASRPDLQFTICMCARYQARPTEKHFLGERLISWLSKRQKSTTISSTEAEYIALSGCCAQILWMRSQLLDYGLGFNKIPMYCDNKSAIALCCNNVQHSRSKHIDIRYHFIKEQVENGMIELYFVNTEYQLVDLFTKALGRDKIEFLTTKLGMRSFTPKMLTQLMNEEDE